MTMISDRDLRLFLVEAKRRTYAGQNDDAAIINPIVPGSKQLEWQSGRLFYRDIYFGMSFFTGQETVYCDEAPVWSMSYSGGVIDAPDDLMTGAIYAFLRDALMLVPAEQPFRGPQDHASGSFIYQTDVEGDLDRFEGREVITRDNSRCYSLIFAGGHIV